MKKRKLALLAGLTFALCVFTVVGCGETHEHTFEKGWSYNETDHWHKATCEHEDEVSGFGAHDFTSGDHCPVCGYDKVTGVAEYTVTFDLGGYTGTETVESQTVNDGTAIDLPAAPTRTNYHFRGWCVGGEGDVYPAGTKYTVRGNVTFVAQWEWNSDTYLVTFLANAPAGKEATGTATPVEVDKGAPFTIPGCTYEVSGYRFAGWTNTPNGKADLTQGEFRVGEQYTPTADVTLYAQWLKGYTDGNGGSDIVYAGTSVVGKGSAVLIREGEEPKLGFANTDPTDESVAVGFEFYFEEEEGGDVVGRLDGDNFWYRGEEYGMYLLKDYLTGKAGGYILYLDGYGNATVNTAVGEMLKATFGVYEKTELGDYDFMEIDPATGQPIPWEDGSFSGFYFALVEGEVTEGAPPEEGVTAPMKGYYYEQGEESGSYAKYLPDGTLEQTRLELNGYGAARVYAVTDEGEKGDLLSEGSYTMGENYENYQGEWEYRPTGGKGFRFILNALLAGYEEGTETPIYLPVYITYDEAHAGTFTADGSEDTLYLDGYGGASCTISGVEYEGYTEIGETLVTLYIYGEEGYNDSKLYFNVDWAQKKFTLFNDGFVIDGGVLVAYTGDTAVKTIVIPDKVTEIAAEVFKDKGITAVTIPASVTKIGANAFQNNYSLMRVTFLGTDVNKIDIDWTAASDPFRWPAGSFVIVVPEAQKEAFKAAWSAAWTAAGRDSDQYRVKGSVEVTLVPEFEVDENGVLIAYNRPAESPEEVNLTLTTGQTEYGGDLIPITAIADGVFMGATYLKSIDLGDVTKIGANAFAECTALESVTFTDVTEIGAGAFMGCEKLKGVIELPAIVTIGESAFLGCSSVTRIKLGAEIKSIASQAFMEIAVEENKIFYLELSDAPTPPAIVASSSDTGVSTHGAFYGNAAYRIVVPNIEYALRCYADGGWASFNTRLMLTPGDEAGAYFDGASTLILNGRAEFLSGSYRWLYKIDGSTITFYSYEIGGGHVAAVGTYEKGRIEFTFEQTHYTFTLSNGSVTYTSEDGAYTLIVDDPKELNPDTWSGTDKIHHTVTVTFNGKETTLTLYGYNDKTIYEYEDEDGKTYKFELTFSTSGNTFTYKKTEVQKRDLEFDSEGYIKDLTCADGSKLSLYRSDKGYIYAYGELKIDVGDGKTLPSFGNDRSTMCFNVEKNVVTFSRPYLNSTKYTITVTIDQAAGTFTYTYTVA